MSPGRQPASPDPWPQLLSQAIRAPSPHNVQPWKLSPTSASEATVYIDMSRALPAEDVTGSFLLSAMGLFVEALRIAAHAQALELSIQMCEEPAELARRVTKTAADLIPFARVSLTHIGDRIDDVLAALLEVRCTGRVAYRMEPLPAAQEHMLRDGALSAGLDFGVTSDARSVRRLLALNTDALFHDLNTPRYHDEIAQWFRCTSSEELSTRDGLSYRCMNMRPWEMKVAKHHPMLLKLPLLSGVFRMRYTQQNLCCSIGHLAGPFFEDPMTAVSYGRGLLRFWLIAAGAGISIHPLGNLVTNPEAAQQVESLLGVRQIWLIFKIGELLGTAPRSLRRPVSEFLVS